MSMIALGRCCVCGNSFTFNPDTVPSLVLDETRRPVCRPCAEAGNQILAKQGRPQWLITDTAYGPADDS